MKVFYVELRHLRADGKRSWGFFECACQSVIELSERFNAGHMVPGFRLQWRWDNSGETGVREVIGSQETTLRSEDIYRVSEPHGRFVRYDDEAVE